MIDYYILVDNAYLQALVYIGTTDNDAFVGNAPVDEIAKQIYESYGKLLRQKCCIDYRGWYIIELTYGNSHTYRSFWVER
jgi:hypothetical protein